MAKPINIWIVIGLILFLMWISYCFPTSEYAYCDGKYHCKINQKFLWFIKIKKDFQLSKYSQLDINIIKVNPRTGNDYYTGYAYFTTQHGEYIKAFNQPIFQETWQDDSRKKANKEIAKFNNYLSYPKIKYKLKSKASKSDIILFVIIGILVAIFVQISDKLKTIIPAKKE